MGSDKTFNERSYHELRHVTHGVQEGREIVDVDDFTRLPNVYEDDVEWSCDRSRVDEARTFAIVGSHWDATRTSFNPHHDRLPHVRQ